MRKRGRPPYPDILTPRESEVVALLREGLSNEEIAQRLGISLAGAKYHVSEILGKLGVATRQEAAAWQPTQRPWWLAAAAPVAFLWRKVSFGPLPGLAAGVAVTAVVAAGVGLLVWGLLRTGGEGEGRPAAIAPAGGATATSCPNGAPLPAANTTVPSLAYAAPDDTIWMVSADGADTVQLVCDAIGAQNAAWSPTGRFMAHARPDGSLWVLDLETGLDTVLDDATTGSVTYRSDPLVSLFRWSPVADSMLYKKFAKENAVSPGAISLGMWAATPGGAPIAVAQRPDVGRSAWSPDGRRIVYEVRSTGSTTPAASRTNQLFLVNVDGADPHKLTDGILILSDHWSPDGRLLAYWKSDHGGSSTIGDIYVMDVDSGREFSLGEFTSDEQPQWSHDRDRHVFYNLAIEPDARSAVGLFNRPSVILSWSPDGTKVAYVDGAAFGPPPRDLVVLDVESRNNTTFHTSNAFTAHAAGSGYRGRWSPDRPLLRVCRAGVGASKIVDGVAIHAGDNRPAWRPAIE